MARPVTLFTGQWADLSLETLAQKASAWGFDGNSEYSYSTDGENFTPFGRRWQLTWGNYRGDRIGIFSYNNKSEAGYLDVDSFRYTFTPPAGAPRP